MSKVAVVDRGRVDKYRASAGRGGGTADAFWMSTAGVQGAEGTALTAKEVLTLNWTDGGYELTKGDGGGDGQSDTNGDGSWWAWERRGSSDNNGGRTRRKVCEALTRWLAGWLARDFEGQKRGLAARERARSQKGGNGRTHTPSVPTGSQSNQGQLAVTKPLTHSSRQ